MIPHTQHQDVLVVCTPGHVPQVVVYDGVAYHQNAEGKTSVLSGAEMSPFMTMAWHFK